MKKLLFGIIFIVLTVSMSDTPQAKVTGECSDCHTMHNSQMGEPMAKELSSSPWGFIDDSTPNPSLLLLSCIGCHTGTGSDTIDTDYGMLPIVFNAQSPTNPLAGGNFYYLLSSGDTRGHNVAGINGPDGTHWLTPPGGAAMSSQLTCAGEYGCHGDRGTSDALEAMKGAHHADDSGGIDGTSVGLSYRFLDGILGKEDSDWEQDNTNTSHNEYKGATIFGDASPISYLCGECHGNTGAGGFHNVFGVGSSSPWLRHPTDYALPNSGEYGSYGVYSMTAPVARPDLSALPGSPTIVRPGTDTVMCLSCHRTHASPYYKMMRWDYTSTTLSTALSGCAVCHTDTGTYLNTAHGNSTSGADRTCCIAGVGVPYSTLYATGHCGHCHEGHASVGGAEPTPPAAEGAKPYSLFMDNYGTNKNELCYGCHETFALEGMPLGHGRYGIYQGRTTYENTVHNNSPNMVWSPDPAPPGSVYDDAGNCHNCHNPHGYDDVPQMQLKWGACEECHDGTQASKDIVSKGGHLMSSGNYSRHSLPEDGSSFGGVNSHAACMDCHNPHTIGGIDTNTPTVHPDYTVDRTSDGNKIYDSTFGSAVLQGVWGVDVESWPGNWQSPASFIELRPSDNPDGAEKEYQICFKCHSTYSDVSGAYRSVARDFNPNNKSRHPVVAGIPALQASRMKDPWKNSVGNQTMYCSDCHGNDAEGPNDPQGVHGSSKSYMLRSFTGTEHHSFSSGSLTSLKDPAGRESFFCCGCHEIYSGTPEDGNFLNPIHGDHEYSKYGHYGEGDACGVCHDFSNVHGWPLIRFLKASYNPSWSNPKICSGDFCGLVH